MNELGESAKSGERDVSTVDTTTLSRYAVGYAVERTSDIPARCADHEKGDDD
ncbi:hypothetical protein ACFS07_34595 [Undibacterium arcticum]